MLVSEAHLEPTQTSKVKLFCENGKRLKVAIFTKGSILIFDWVLCTLEFSYPDWILANIILQSNGIFSA